MGGGSERILINKRGVSLAIFNNEGKLETTAESLSTSHGTYTLQTNIYTALYGTASLHGNVFQKSHLFAEGAFEHK